MTDDRTDRTADNLYRALGAEGVVCAHQMLDDLLRKAISTGSANIGLFGVIQNASGVITVRQEEGQNQFCIAVIGPTSPMWDVVLSRMAKHQKEEGENITIEIKDL